MADDTNNQRDMLVKINGLHDIIKALVDRVGANQDRTDRFDAEFEKLSKQNHVLRQEILTNRQEIVTTRRELQAFKMEASNANGFLAARFDAMASRFDDIENLVEKNSAGIFEVKSEAMLHYNSLVNVLHESD